MSLGTRNNLINKHVILTGCLLIQTGSLENLETGGKEFNGRWLLIEKFVHQSIRKEK
jgi:hypothetical protein